MLPNFTFIDFVNDLLQSGHPKERLVLHIWIVTYPDWACECVILTHEIIKSLLHAIKLVFRI